MKLWPFARKDADNLTMNQVLARIAAASMGKSGQVVNRETALRVTTAYAVARVIAEGLAQVPFKLYRVTGDSRTEAREHQLFRLLHRKPNSWQTSFEFREMLGLHLVFCNNAFVFKNRVRGQIVELIPLEPGQVTVKRAADYSLSYQLRLGDGSVVTMDQTQIWHLRGPSWNGWMGLDAVRLAREALGLALATEEHGARLFSNGAQLGGVLVQEPGAKPLTDEQIETIRSQFARRHEGGEAAFRTAILQGGLKWQDTALKSDDAQFLETRKFQVEEICRAFRVLPIMVGFSDKNATYASVEQMLIAHVVHTMMPWYERFEESADAALLSDAEMDQGLGFKFVIGGLLRGALKDQADFYMKMYQIRALNPNEIRAFMELNPYDGGELYGQPLASATSGAAADPQAQN